MKRYDFLIVVFIFIINLFFIIKPFNINKDVVEIIVNNNVIDKTIKLWW